MLKRNLILCAAGISFVSHSPVDAKSKPNVLFIVVDDLRPELNCYGASYMHTPNIDRLANNGTVFQRAYCQQAISAPSRNSLLTGLRPDAIGIYNLRTFFRTNVPDVVTLPQHFKNSGYRVEGVGKVFHADSGNKEDYLSWSVKWIPDEILGKIPEINHGDTTNVIIRPSINGKALPYYASPYKEEEMLDGRTVKIAVDRLKALKDSTFFLAVGISKPHLPFVAPKKYWDLYKDADIVIPERKSPKGMPKESMDFFNELKNKYYNIPKEGYIDDETSRGMIHGYRACVSYIDEQIGKLLKTVDENGLAENTIIVLWGDHGWKLGEYGNWCKHTNMEFDTNAPLIFVAPGYAKNQQTYSMSEFVDVYPTLCELAGLSTPDHLQGQSLVPILKNPTYKVKQVAISQYPRGKNCEIMGYSMRTEKYRYTRWINFFNGDKKVVATELYDQSKGKLVDENLATKLEYQSTVKELDNLLTTELAKYKKHISIQ